MTTDLEAKQIRVAVVGTSCIGKTLFSRRFVENTFHGSQYSPTPGVDFFARRMSLKSVGTVTFIISDVAGSAINSKMLGVFLHHQDLFLLAYDMTNATSLNELRKWITIITAFSGSRADEPCFALVGLKGDLDHLRQIRLDAHTRFAQEYNIPLSFLTSAKSGESVITCFSKCAIYHLNPEAKQRVREHAILQASVAPSKRATLGVGPPHNHPILLPTASQGSIPIRAAGSSSGGGGANAPLLDPTSTVCVIQ